jgi:transcriptional regulator with XRE-family HTH domain
MAKDRLLHPVDLYVGTRLKKRRQELGVTQEELGNLISLTFQQIQKYERGFNRISSSKLFEISKVLKTDVSYFFNGLDAYYEYNKEITPHLRLAEAGSDFNSMNENIDADIKRSIESFLLIKNQKVRDNIVSLLESLAEEQ